uniref:Epoxide hydrolase N-terminal domain-containing protein n=1 Tax=Odontella aurita TaxID=265563 RepID=A0A7S4N8D7_9STRA|mmetsp:Transcript_52852/g.158205  ORF Transcript_52852/g.158205 Transcript_52852/m.158205 type:complete len:480 (+) Transcript_52852:105-1544(+)
MTIVRAAAILAVVPALAFLLLCCHFGPGPGPADLLDRILLPRAPSPEESSGRPRRWGPHNDTTDADGGSTIIITPYTVRVDDTDLVDLRSRLDRWKPPGAPMDHDGSWNYGMDSTYMSALVQYWKDGYDWRKYESRLNDLGLMETSIDGLKIRFHDVRRGDDDDEKRKALLLLHGWPGSVWEFQNFLRRIIDRKDLNDFSIVCPCLPGYGFSDSPVVEGYNVVAMAGTMQRLMKRLGYERYIVQAGDWGSIVAQSMAYLDPTPVIGLHLNFFSVSPTPGHFLPERLEIKFRDDEDSRSRARKGGDLGGILSATGYLHQQATKPETLGYALSDSPVGLCAWIAEKFQSWSDPNVNLGEKFSMDDILTNCMIYWITNSINSSMRLYKEQFRTDEAASVDRLPVEVPAALSLFPHEIFPPADASVRRKFKNIILFSKHDVGGHFAALEQPALLLQDLADFVDRLRAVARSKDDGESMGVDEL